MKKFFAFLVIIFLILISLLIYFRAQIMSAYLTYDFNMPVHVGNVWISSKRLVLQDFIIKNPKNSKTENAFFCSQLSVDFHLKDLFAKTFSIDAITLSHTHVWVELYNKSGSENNWAFLLENSSSQTNNNHKPYLIRTLKIQQLSPTLVELNGKKKRGPTIGEMVFHNLSDNTGFPIDQIERAVIHAFLPATYRILSIEHLLETITPIKIFSDFFSFNTHRITSHTQGNLHDLRK